LYSGTVAAAIEGAFFGITSIAVSLEYNEHAQFAKAARLARGLIEQLLELKGSAARLYNINIPTSAIDQPRGVRVVPMGVQRYGEHYLKRTDPRGRTYYWATNEPPPPPGETETDLMAIRAGYITVTPLQFDMTHGDELERMRTWNLTLPTGS
jgi:5'-nucleotidase